MLSKASMREPCLSANQMDGRWQWFVLRNKVIQTDMDFPYIWGSLWDWGDFKYTSKCDDPSKRLIRAIWQLASVTHPAHTLWRSTKLSTVQFMYTEVEVLKGFSLLQWRQINTILTIKNGLYITGAHWQKNLPFRWSILLCCQLCWKTWSGYFVEDVLGFKEWELGN